MGLFRFRDKPVPEGTTREYRGVGGFLSLAFSHMTRLVLANLLFLLFSIPVVTLPAANAGLTAVALTVGEDRFTPVWRTFFTAFKRDFWAAELFGLPCLALIGLTAFGAYTYCVFFIRGNWAAALPLALSFILLALLCGAQPFGYIQIAAIDLPLKTIVKNSLLLALLGSWRTLLLLALYVVVFALALWFLPIGFAAAVLVGCALTCFLACFMGYPVIEKYVLAPYYAKKQDNG